MRGCTSQARLEVMNDLDRLAAEVRRRIEKKAPKPAQPKPVKPKRKAGRKVAR